VSKPWTTREEADVRAVHASGIAYSQMMHLWPGRNARSVACHASEMGLGERPTPIRRDISRMLPLVLERLANGPCLAYDIADKIGACREWVGRLLRANLASDAPKVQVVRWHRDKKVGPYREVWALGEGEIAPRPVVYSRSERRRLEREANRARKASPFAVAAGLTAAPVGRAGRVVRKLGDDELEAA
jgi:hypothetical protein